MGHDLHEGAKLVHEFKTKLTNLRTAAEQLEPHVARYAWAKLKPAIEASR